ncbi:Peptidyl-prolyl cis-trans isomerase FKBP16-1 [Spatholobus suberectus]|nr:Peptidyl-prolyl cis-trans isomerase FKBP16-1 [Spatholobus suberectus]
MITINTATTIAVDTATTITVGITTATTIIVVGHTDNALFSFELGWYFSAHKVSSFRSQPEFSNSKLSMGVLPFLLVPPPCAPSVSASPRCMEEANLNYAESKRVSTLTVKKIPRRMILRFLGVNLMICYASPALAAPIMPDMKEPEVIRTLKLPSGVRIQGIHIKFSN